MRCLKNALIAGTAFITLLLTTALVANAQQAYTIQWEASLFRKHYCTPIRNLLFGRYRMILSNPTIRPVPTLHGPYYFKQPYSPQQQQQQPPNVSIEELERNAIQTMRTWNQPYAIIGQTSGPIRGGNLLFSDTQEQELRALGRELYQQGYDIAHPIPGLTPSLIPDHETERESPSLSENTPEVSNENQGQGPITWNWSPSAKHHEAIVNIISEENGPRSFGGGTYVTFNDCQGILTAAHNIEGGLTAIIGWSDGSKTRGKVCKDGKGHDLGWVQVTDPPEGIEPIEIGEITSEGQVELIGFGGPNHDFRHFWANVEARASPVQIAVSKPSATNGDSGGAWIQRGKLIGVTSRAGGENARWVDEEGNVQQGTAPGSPGFVIGEMSTSPPLPAIRDFVTRAVASGYG